ncbi:MAG: hypothetical protein ACOYI4_02375 [Christensenellales bacterium]|jgi:hypothetical protein
MKRISLKYSAVTLILLLLIGGIYFLTSWPQGQETIGRIVNAPIYRGDHHAVLCVILDDGTEQEMLDALQREGLSVTFFLTQSAVSNPVVLGKIKEMSGEFAVAGPGQDSGEACAALAEVRIFLKEQGLSAAPYYMPLSELRREVADLVAREGLSVVQCGIDSLDTRLEDSSRIAAAVLRNLRQGAFVQMHGYARTAKALADIADGAVLLGVDFGTVSSALKQGL